MKTIDPIKKDAVQKAVKTEETPDHRFIIGTEAPAVRKVRGWWDRTLAYYGSLFSEFLLKDKIERMYLIMGGHIYFQTVSAAVQLDLFTLLSDYGKLSRVNIAALLELEEKPVRILLLGLVSLGLLQKKGEFYSNTALANMTLTRRSRKNIIAIIKWQHHINYRAMYSFYDAIKKNSNVGLSAIEGTEPTLYERLAHNPELETIFQDAMQAISIQANEMLARFVDFSQVKHVVDVGGGNGSNIITLARRNPHLRASVFDSSSVCEIARENIKKVQLQERLGAVEGNCFTTPFPRDADCIIFCHFFTIWSEEKNRALLKKAFDALPKGGRVMVFNMMQRNDESGPLSASMGSPYFLTLATGEGMLYTWNEYERWMKEAGFATVSTQVLPRDHGVIVGVKA